ncbi:MAG TPA: hypothetical protein PK297_01170 [Spirochaetota bacterium]|nr:hypothetical protein [Spirochaetota bacterium]
MDALLNLLKMVSLGCATGWIMYRVLKKHTFGHLWGAMITGIVGAFLGHFVLGSKIIEVELLDIKIVAALIGSFSLVWLLSKVSPE